MNSFCKVSFKLQKLYIQSSIREYQRSIMENEKTSFTLVFGDSPVAKVLDFLIDNQEFDYSLTDIAKGAEIAWSTLHEFWQDLVRLEIVR